VRLLFVDGEESLVRYGPRDGLHGSRRAARRLVDNGEVGRIAAVIVVDMIGDRDLDIHPESNSNAVASAVYAVALEISEQLGYNAFHVGGTYNITDDHVFLIERGIKMYDFIDFNYPNYPHSVLSDRDTTEGTEDKCSRESLEIVGRVVENIIYCFPDLYAPDNVAQD